LLAWLFFDGHLPGASYSTSRASSCAPSTETHQGFGVEISTVGSAIAVAKYKHNINNLMVERTGAIASSIVLPLAAKTQLK